MTSQQTTPAKALTTNAGLKELSHSITGGSVAAQGYWMPFSCARAICMTFCYDVRWALVPIFGYEFVDQCLLPHHADFAKFKISSETVQDARRMADGYKTVEIDPGAGPATLHCGGPQDIPMRAPVPTPQHHQHHHHHYRQQPYSFGQKSPFDSEPEGSNRCYSRNPIGIGSPEISPKTRCRTPAKLPSAWTSINRGDDNFDLLVKPPNCLLAGSFLTPPHPEQSHGFRPVDHSHLSPLPSSPLPPPPTLARSHTKVHEKSSWPKRRMSNDSESDINEYKRTCSEDEIGESDEEEIVAAPKKRQRKEGRLMGSPLPSPAIGRSTRYTAADVRAAQVMMMLRAEDSLLRLPDDEMDRS